LTRTVNSLVPFKPPTTYASMRGDE